MVLVISTVSIEVGIVGGMIMSGKSFTEETPFDMIFFFFFLPAEVGKADSRGKGTKDKEIHSM